MVINILTSKSIYTGPQFQAPYILPILYLGVFGIIFFERVNISKFLERFENMYNDY